MLTFACPTCGRLVTFESAVCLHCTCELGYDPASATIRAVDPEAGGEASRRCANAGLAACNWLVDSEHDLCASCALTRTRPEDGDEDGLGGWVVAEAAKRRLLFELDSLGLPLVGRGDQPGGLSFDFLSSARAPVTTGHADGVITLDLDETDPACRERLRVRLGEPYRTVLGHLRHEVAHYYEPILVAAGTAEEARCRDVFGDESEDYQGAMDRYYAAGAPPGWEQRFVTAYATMHAWEDWAETFAHYLHIRDALQTAAAYGLRVDGPQVETADAAPLHSQPADPPRGVRAMLDAWLPLTYALNAINRSMGAADLYPFVLTPEIGVKLAYIDARIGEAAADADQNERGAPGSMA